MWISDSDLIRHIASYAKLTEMWCAEAIRMLAFDDVSKIVEDELTRLRRSHLTRQTKGHGKSGLLWNEDEMQEKIQARAHHLYATKRVRPMILESVSLACWGAPVEFARVEELYGRVSAGDSLEVQRLKAQRWIGQRLGIDKTNINRWEKFATLPDGGDVLGAILIALEDELAEFAFPKRRELLTNAARRVLALIRERKYRSKSAGKIPERLPTGEELWTVRTVLRHELADCMLSNEKAADSAKRAVLSDVGQSFDGRFPKHPGGRAKSIQNAIDEWAFPYAFFRIALVSGWPDGTEDEWNWEDIDDDETPI